MAIISNKAPKAGAKGFLLNVMPSRDALDEALSMNGQCSPTDCWHYVAINWVLDEIDPGGKHNVKVDAGHVRCNYKGYKYLADTPRHVKRSLMLFDAGRYDEVRVRGYSLRFRRVAKIQTLTADRRAAIAKAQARRRAEGRRSMNDMTLRKRVEGFSSIV